MSGFITPYSVTPRASVEMESLDRRRFGTRYLRPGTITLGSITPRSMSPIGSIDMDSLDQQRLVPIYLNDTERSADGLAIRKIDSNQQARTTGIRKSLPIMKRILAWIIQKRAIFWSLISTAAAICWMTMMTYFLIYYLTLPRYEGVLPRINRSYATFPYVSSIGEELLSASRGFSIAVAACSVATFNLDLYLCRKIMPARNWRYAKAGAAWTSSIFLVLLSFYGVEEYANLQLGFTSISIIATGSTRFFNWIQTRILLKYSPKSRHILRPLFWKEVAACTAASMSILAAIGIYGCRDILTVPNPGSTCNTLVKIAAPCEWILAASWIVYLLAVAGDLYHMEFVREDLIARTLLADTHKLAAGEFESLLSYGTRRD